MREILSCSLLLWCPVEICARDIVMLSSPLVSSGELCERYCQALFSSGFQWRAVREILSGSLLLWCPVESCARDIVWLSFPLVSNGELCERYCHASSPLVSSGEQCERYSQ